MSKVTTGGGAWLKGSDIQPGDTAIIKDEAVWIQGEYKGTATNQYCATVDYKGEDRTLKFTKLSRTNMLPLGDDSVNWVGKKISLTAADIMVDGQMRKTIIVTPFTRQDDTEPKPVNPEEIDW